MQLPTARDGGSSKSVERRGLRDLPDRGPRFERGSMKISQREARRLKQLVARLENQEDNRRNAWWRDYPGGANIATITCQDAAAKIHVARLLKRAVVATVDGNTIRLFALPLGSRA